MDDQNRYGRRQVTDIYSFAGDFNDVCAMANTELTSLGFVEETRPGDESHRRRYRLVGKRPGEFSTVTIMDNHKSSVYSTPANSEYSSPDVQSYHFSDGWVAVEVSQTQRTLGWLQSMRRWLRGPVQSGPSQP
jgi:hypothetical protein